jgi:hypothetical protein
MKELFRSIKLINPDKKQCIETAVLISGGILLYGLIQKEFIFGWISLATSLISLLIPLLFYYPAKVWFSLALVISFFSSHLLLSLLFFLVVTPIGLLRRGLGKDSLTLRQFKKAKGSTMRKRNHTFSSEDLQHPF